MSDPNEVAFLLITYLLFVLKIGPHLMENRGPLQIKPLLVVYNGFNVVNSAILAYRFFSYVMDNGLFAKSCDINDVNVYKMAVLYWKYTATKILHLFETIFLILRKKKSQITYLHICHHVFIVVVTWSTLKYSPSDHWAFMALVHCSVHAVMSTFYGVSAIGSKCVWWPKYGSVLLLIQLVLVSIHLLGQTYISQCPMHAGTYWIDLANIILFMILLADFYKKRRGRIVAVELACFKHAE